MEEDKNIRIDERGELKSEPVRRGTFANALFEQIFIWSKEIWPDILAWCDFDLFFPISLGHKKSFRVCPET